MGPFLILQVINLDLLFEVQPTRESLYPFPETVTLQVLPERCKAFNMDHKNHTAFTEGALGFLLSILGQVETIY